MRTDRVKKSKIQDAFIVSCTHNKIGSRCSPSHNYYNMITPKYISITLALIASSAAAVGAFTTTRTSFSPTSICYPVLQLQPRASFVSTPLQLLKKDMAATEDQPLLKAVENPADIDNGKNDLIAPSIYAAYTAALIFIIYQLRDAIVTKTLGSTALAFVTGALIWDNLIISIGSFFFKDIDTNPQKYKILKWLSYPRFTFHAIGVPLQLITVAEMGKFAGVGFLQSDVVQIGIILASFALVSAGLGWGFEIYSYVCKTDNALLHFS